MAESGPRLNLSAGLRIGYQHTAIADTPAAIELASGTHFLLARNGRGKTTLLRTIAGTLKPIQGSVSIAGFLQSMPEDLRFDNELPVHSLFRAMIPKGRFAEALMLAESIELDTRKEYGKLSTGNRRKAALIVAEFSIRPETGNILLLDEPFSGLDAYARAAFEKHWRSTSDKILRLVSCHPDYDSMEMPSVLMIQDGKISQHVGTTQNWSHLKALLS